MNEHIPNSSGLPLRAMVMVLLFLGVVFLLVGFQAMGSSGDKDDSAPLTARTTTSAAASTSAKPAAKPVVRVYNISDEEGVAGRAADELRGAGWPVGEVGNMSMPDVTSTTVYYGDTDGEHEAADEVGDVLHAPVEPRTPELADQPPGVIVAVTP
ncbi:MAG TPA: LytR C-terminal domain-containing protein [Mycobacterium sp.]|nr:LytR C-terminal domain-containing protein [Mycobacterium sp.]